MKAFVLKVDTAQSITQWHWRTPVGSRYREPLRPDLTDSRTRCRKLPSRGSRAPTANHQSRSGATLSSGVGKPETSHGVVNYHKVTLKKKHRRNHSHRANGERIRDGTTAMRRVK